MWPRSPTGRTATPTSPTTCRWGASRSRTTWRKPWRSWPIRCAAGSSTARPSPLMADGMRTVPGSHYGCPLVADECRQGDVTVPVLDTGVHRLHTAGVDPLDLARARLTSTGDLSNAVAWCAEYAALPAVLALVGHHDPGVRRAVAQALPRLSGAPRPPAVVSALVTLSADPVAEVRDWACYGLGTRLSEVDTPALRDALADRPDQAEPRAVEIAEAVRRRLRGDEEATARLLASRLAVVAGAHGWVPGAS